jgi:4-hydroxy-tetrahydrodipicolinate synthase
MTHFDGVTTALLTPFSNGQVDYNSLGELIARQLDAKVSNILLLGTTAECSLLTKTERKKLLEFAKTKIEGNAKIIVGIGVSATPESVSNARDALKGGAEGLLVVLPYYTKSTVVGLEQHFDAIKQAVDLPIIAYNVPHRTGYNMDLKLLKKLSTEGIVMAVKEASDNFGRARYIDKHIDGLDILCGSDGLLGKYRTLDHFSGVVSVLSNCVPTVVAEAMYGDARCGKILAALVKACQCEVSPVAAKYLAYRLGIIATPEMRLPLTALSEDYRGKIDRLVDFFGGQLK